MCSRHVHANAPWLKTLIIESRQTSKHSCEAKQKGSYSAVASSRETTQIIWLIPELALCWVSGESAIAGAARIPVEPLELSFPNVAVPGLPEKSVARL